jgi:two-component system, NarL family, sensor histidine kinase UhpB
LEPRGALRLAVFLLSAILISWLNDARRTAQGRLTQLNAELEQRIQQRTEQLRHQRDELRNLTSQLALTEERERRAIAQRLHDEVSTLLYLAQMKLGCIEQLPEPQAREVGEACRLLDQAMQRTRGITYELSPPVLYDLGLEAAVQWLAEQTRKQAKIDVLVESHLPSLPLDEAERILLFGVIRELLHNVVKHADATRCQISLCGEEGMLAVTVEDDGRGFDGEAARGRRGDSFGLFSITQRLQHVGGQLEIETPPDGGSRCKITFPVPHPQGKLP